MARIFSARTWLDRRWDTWRDAVEVRFANESSQGSWDLVSSSTEARYAHR